MAIFQNCNQRNRYQTPISLFLVSWIYSLYYEEVRGNLRGAHLNIPELQNMFFLILPNAQYYNRTYVINDVIAFKYKYTSVSSAKFESNHRKSYTHEIDVEEQCYFKMLDHCDTLTNEDMVRKQYFLLPYPAITKKI